MTGAGGAATTYTTTAIVSCRPRDPSIQLVSIDLVGFHLNFSKPPTPVLDMELILTVHVTNPNIVPINYNSSTMSIHHEGHRLGSAQIPADSQTAKSCKILRLPARLDSVELANPQGKILTDTVSRREMELTAAVDVSGTARVLLWAHGFKIHVENCVKVDPLYLDVIEQDNRSQLQLLFGLGKDA